MYSTYPLEAGSLMTEIHDDSPGQRSKRSSKDIYNIIYILFFE